MMKEKYVEFVEKFVEHCKRGDIYNRPFDFKINDGNVAHIFGIVLVKNLDNLIFVISIYGDNSGSSVSVFSPDTFKEDFFNEFENDDWDYFFEEFLEYFYNEYKNWGEPIIITEDFDYE